MGSTVRWLLREWVRPVLPVLLIMIAIRSAVADWNDVPTGSMNPTILEGDRVFVDKLAYSLRFPLTRWHLIDFAEPKRGDIVVFISPHDGTRLVKRVIGLPGDTVELRANQLLLNGKPVDYDPVSADKRREIAPTMPQNWPVAIEELPARSHPVMGKPSVQALRSFGPVKVPKDNIFAMGDSRDDSFDSRYFGPVDENRILGKATHVVVSVDPSHHYLPRWNRFLTRLP